MAFSCVNSSKSHHRVFLPRRFCRNLQRRKRLIRFTHFVDVLLRTHPCNQHYDDEESIFRQLWWSNQTREAEVLVDDMKKVSEAEIAKNVNEEGELKDQKLSEIG